MQETIAEYGRIFIIGFVLSFIFAVPALGWEPCPVCQHWSTSQNRCVNDPDGGDCAGECSRCWNGVCIDDSDDCGACERCDSHECWDINCDPTECESCINHWCVVCENEPYTTCCDGGIYEGTCYDWRTEKCCDGWGNTCPDEEDCCDGDCCGGATPQGCDDIGGVNDGYCCSSGETCCEGNCCSPDKCCNNGTCVDKCDPAGETCEHDTPVLEAGCQSIAPDDLRCFPDQIGKVCMWNLQYHYETSATCAFCAPGCRTRDDFCTSYKAETCRNAWFIGCVCNYDGPENGRPRADLGDHYSCN
jgi:hypothetical protein